MRFLSLNDEPVVPVGGYVSHQIKMAITTHWHWMQDSFKVGLQIGISHLQPGTQSEEQS